MLSESSYHTAIYVYVAAASGMLLYITWRLARRWRSGWVALVVVLMGILLLTPAHPNATVTTMAPALIVAAFQILTDQQDAAWIALRPVVYLSGLAMVLAMVLKLVLLRRAYRRRKWAPPEREEVLEPLS